MATTPASVGKHPLHPMLVALPIGLLTFSVVADLVVLFGWGGNGWRDTAHFTLSGGIISGFLAAIPGIIDFLSLRDSRTRQIGRFHLVSNVSALLVFILSWALRQGRVEIGLLPPLLSCAGLLLLVIGGWLGGKLVYEHGVAVASSGEPGDEPVRNIAVSPGPASPDRPPRADR